jgi:hypothetical protein
MSDANLLDLRKPERRSTASGTIGDFEAMAARVVARLTGHKVILQDDGSSEGMPDIRIEYPDGSKGYAEVVMDYDASHGAMSAEVLKRSGEITAPGLNRSWWLWLSADCNLRRLEQAAPQLLRTLEEEGSLFEMTTQIADASGARDRTVTALRRLGVTRLGSFTSIEEPQRLRLIPEGTGGKHEIASNEFLASLQDLLADGRLEDVRTKLGATQARERHLFVGITYTSSWPLFNWLAAEWDALPEGPPILPDEVTHLWLMQAPPLGRCLTWSRNHGWRDTRRHWVTT